MVSPADAFLHHPSGQQYVPGLVPRWLRHDTWHAVYAVLQVHRHHVGEGSLVEVGGGVALDDLDDGQAKLFGELPVAGIVGRHGHDGAGAVGSQNVVGDEDGDLLVVDGVDAPDAFQLNAGLFLVQLAALEVALAGSLGLISLDGVGILDGYNALIDALLEGTEVRLNTNYFSNRNELDALADNILFTGCIDHGNHNPEPSWSFRRLWFVSRYI